MWPRPDPRSMSRSRSLWSCKNCTFLGLSPPSFSHGAQKWWLIVIVWDLIYGLRNQIIEFPTRKAIARVQTSRNVDISRNSNGHILLVREATVRWLGKLVGIAGMQVLCMLIWPWPDPRSRSRLRGFWISENCNCDCTYAARSRACWRQWPSAPLPGFFYCHCSHWD